jgi:hypothetical protein
MRCYRYHTPCCQQLTHVCTSHGRNSHQPTLQPSTQTARSRLSIYLLQKGTHKGLHDLTSLNAEVACVSRMRCKTSEGCTASETCTGSPEMCTLETADIDVQANQSDMLCNPSAADH